MTKNFRVATISALLVSLLGCAGSEDARPRWSDAPEIPVAEYSTFGWSDRTGKPPVTILDNQIRNAVRAELVARGYVESSDTADFLVHHEPVEQQTVKQGSPVRIGIGIGTRSGNVGGSVGTSVDVGEKDQVLQQIRISIRAMTPDGREAWNGTTAAIAQPPDETAVERAVAGVMKGFPHRSGAGH